MPTASSTRLACLLTALLLYLTACHSGDKVPQIPFDALKWSVQKDGQYVYRKQMIQDLLHNHQWTGMSKAELQRKLGPPNAIENDGLLLYEYERRPFLGGLGTAVETLVFEMATDSTVKRARLNDGGWD